MSLWRRKKTAEDCMREILALGSFERSFTYLYSMHPVDWLDGFAWTKDNKAIYVSHDLAPYVTAVYVSNREINKTTVVNKKEVEALRKENAELKKEIERLSQPTGRKILIEEKETTA